MVYDTLTFPQKKDRPFFYTSFVSTVDGKVWVNKKGYWPIGSKTDFETFTYLRAHADAIIDGKGTALQFGKATIDTIHSDNFQSLRKEIRKNKDVLYFVMTKHPDGKLEKALGNSYNFKPQIFTEGIDIFVSYCNKEGLDTVFVDGGPTLLASFLEKNLIDEVFLTITPKIFGNDGSAVTMVEGKLFDPQNIKNFTLISTQQVGDEVFLRYRILDTSTRHIGSVKLIHE